ncbi:hypothetical protein FBU59_000181 [Linderina macrospora]|uniref:Uncharacterized protein n=1 Tax=Linderina macrospora TaxID=4868 RepID=A0ACC1JHE5_9FUNG|nr:hypothetical protein FBU59_000181 [Linderina macrospora]
MAAAFSDTNIAELETLRGQLQQLQESFGTITEETRPDTPHIMPWPMLLSKFNVLAARYATLSQAVNRNHASLLQQMVVAPQKQLQSDHELQILSVLLRTKLAPEIEREEERIKGEMEEEAKADQQQLEFGSQIDNAGNLKYWQAKTEVHDSLALTAEVAFKELRKRHANTVDAILAAKPGKRHEDMDVDEPAKTAAAERGEEEDPKGAVALEDILAFVSSGARA